MLDIEPREPILKVLTQLLSKNGFRIADIIKILYENRLILLINTILEEERTLNNSFLALFLKVLKKESLRLDNLKKYRNIIIERSVFALQTEEIEYALFKTPMWFPTWGADVDIMVPKSNHNQSLEALLKNGFQLFDDPHKPYEIGLYLKRNPVLLDLHTKITFVSIPYIDSDYVLKNTERVQYLRDGKEPLMVNCANDVSEALIRVGHSVIKEQKITLVDLCIFLKSLTSSNTKLQKDIKGQGLMYALSIFFLPLNSVFGDTILYKQLSKLEIVPNPTVRAQTTKLKSLPWHVPIFYSIHALISRLGSRPQIGLNLLAATSSLRYKRNVQRLWNRTLKAMRK